MHGLVFNADAHVAAWCWKEFQRHPMFVDKAVGIINDRQQIVGAIIWQNYNGCNVEVSYYGPETMSLGIVRNIALCTLNWFEPTRGTIITSTTNKRLVKFLKRLGARFECNMQDYYGRKAPAARFCIPRDVIEKLAGRRTSQSPLLH